MALRFPSFRDVLVAWNARQRRSVILKEPTAISRQMISKLKGSSASWGLGVALKNPVFLEQGMQLKKVGGKQ
jgi:hypothetical protein